MHNIKIIFLLSLLSQFSYGCATCMLMVPSVEVDTKLHIEKKKLHQIDFTWHFSNEFTNELIPPYDKNSNKILDKEELDDILQAKMDYLVPKHMLTSIQYADENASEPTDLHPRFENYAIKVVNDSLVFTYQAKLQKKIFDNANLAISLSDDEGYFTFRMKELGMNKCDFAYSKNLYLFTASMLFKDKALMHEITEPVEVQNARSEPFIEKSEEKDTVPKLEETPEPFQEGLLKSSMAKIKSLFESIKDEKNPMTYLFLLFFSFLYGVIHAMGPGHGKTLVASYFLSNDRSYSKAFFISLAIGVVHTFSAFILTLIIYFLVNTLLAQFLDDTVYYTTKISALIIIGIALYLIHKKYRLYRQVEEEHKAHQFTFSSSPVHVSTCGCGSCKVDKNSTDTALIISAGIIPCPGTTTLFIFAISTGLYYAGFISALVMSLGMSSVIFISALLSTVIRQRVLTSSDTLKKYLEFISLGLILILGSLLLFI